MADYTVRIVAETDEAEKKVDKLDKKVVQVTEERKLNITFPSFSEIIENFKTLGRVIKTTWDIAGKTPLFGGRINDFQEVLETALTSIGKLKAAIVGLTKLTPGNILQGAFTGTVSGIEEVSKKIANIGFTIFGVTQSINVLKGAFGQFFTETIGREIRLQESLLRTKTTLASTADVAVNGKRLTDPYEAILKLEGPVNQTIENIRRRSLDIAGTTSDAIIQVFGVVASQIGNIGGGFKEAEDLAITFSAALGTLGLSDPMYATQEIRSILTGTIDQNSVLARSLGLTNEEVAKAKNSAEGLVEFLKRRLGAFTAGQSLAAKGFAGITSNIEEFAEEVKRSLGKGMLGPLLEGLTVLYERLQLVFKSSLGIADALGRSFGAIGKGVVGAAAAAPLLQGFTQRSQVQAFDKGEAYAVELAVKTQKIVDNLRPEIAGLTNQIVAAVAQLSQGLRVLAEGMVAFKVTQLEVYMAAFANLGRVLNSTVIPAFTALMQVYGELLKTPLLQFLNAAAVDFGLLERVGVMPLIRVIFTLSSSLGGAWGFIQLVGKGAQWLMRQLAGLADVIIMSLSMAISALSTALKNLGSALVWLGTQGVATLLTGIGAIAREIGLLLTGLAQVASTAAPQFQILAKPLADIAKAFFGINKAADAARQKIGKFALDAAAALDKLEIKTQEVRQGIESLGQRISGVLGAGISKLGDAIKGFIKGIIGFFASMLAWQLLFLGIYELITKVQLKMQDIGEKTRAEIAVKRLTTIYQDLGANASAAAKALRAVEEAVLSSRIDKVEKSYGELNDTIENIKKMGSDKNIFTRSFKNVMAIMNPMNFDVRPGLNADGTQERFAEALLKKRRSEAAALKNELETLTRAQKKIQDDAKATEDVRILAKERFAMEKELKELRKTISKELSDQEWTEKQKVLELEQRMKETLFAKERTEMERRHTQENQNLGSIGQQFATIFDEYQKNVFDAQVESEKRQFDMATRRAELEKQVDDYRYRLEQQTMKLREKMGEMNKKIVDYEAERRIQAARAVLDYTMKAKAFQTEGIIVGGDEIKKFNDKVNQNARSGEQLSATRLLTVMKAVGIELGLSPTMNPSNAVDTALAGSIKMSTGQQIDVRNLVNRAAMSDQAFLGMVNALTADKYGQSTLGTHMNQAALDELGNRRYLKTKTVAPPKMGDLSSYLNVDRETAQMRASLEGTFRKNEEYMRLMNNLDFARPMEEFKKAMNDPNLWRIESVGELREQIKQLGASVSLTENALSKGRLPTKLDELKSNLDLMFDVVLDTFAAKEIKQIQANKALTPAIQRQATDSINKMTSDTRRRGASATLKAIADWDNKTHPIVQRFTEVIKAYLKFTDQLPQIAKAFNELTIAQVENAIADATKAAADIRPRINDAFIEFTELLQSLIPGGYSLDKANMRSALQAQQFTTSQLMGLPPETLGDPAAVQGILDKGEQLRQQYESVNAALHPMREALENFKTRLDLAATSTQIFVDAHRSFAEEMITGSQDLGTAIQNFGETISKNFVSKFLDYALRPMQDQMFETFKRIFGVQDAETAAREAILQGQRSVAQALAANTLAVDANTRSKMGVPGAVAPGQGGPDAFWAPANAPKVGEFVGGPAFQPKAPAVIPPGPIALPIVPSPGSTPAPAIPTPDPTAYQAGLDKAAEALNASATTTNQQVPKTMTWGQALGGATQALAGIAMGIAGAQQMGKGGTYNTLMGLAGIFGALGSITGMFGTGGVFAAKPAGKAASGGPIKANRPYLVGEIGPELFMPNSDGEILSNAKSRKLLSAAALAGKTQTFSTNVNSRRNANPAQVQFDFAYQSEVINNVEYVTSDQFRKGMADSAERGKNMAFAAMQNNVSTRRRLGL